MANTRKRNWGQIMIPFALSAGIGMGLWLGLGIGDNGGLTPGQRKLATILSLIEKDYVDTLDLDDVIDLTLADLMTALDPHSAYISKSDFAAVNGDLEGSFSGVGISFQILRDSVTVVEVIAGGPAEKVGILAGDRIVSADGEPLAGPDVTQEDVMRTLRGEKGTKVKLKIKRSSSPDLLPFDVIRGDIPVNSVDSYYMLSADIGYVKVGKFARNTYSEFYDALTELKSRGARKFIVDLRGNTGGFMDQAIIMANEFLPSGKLIVYTKGRSPENETVAASDGTGSFIDSELVVLTNEYSASASEIFAGAIQDNDRGLVIGRRTFGKGLVQNQTILSDSSAIRLTVARYYTPSGRSIQKEYQRGKDGKYMMDIADRYSHGEFYNPDSIKLDKSKKFHTVGGRVVYGGGGIMPDIFVPEDTTGYTSYYVSIVNGGLIQKFAFEVADRYRDLLRNTTKIDQVLKIIPRDDTLLNNFVEFAVANGVPARWYYIRRSRELLLGQIKAMIVRDVLGYNEFYEVLNRQDRLIREAQNALNNGKSPVVIKTK